MAHPRALVVEGWRSLSHSYCVVNQFQLLALQKMDGLCLFHRDLPLYRAEWRPVTGLFAPDSEKGLARIPPPPPDLSPGALYRIGFPYDLSPADAERTVVFATSELLWVGERMLARPESLKRQMAGSKTVIVTPSRWSKKGFVRSGAPAHRVEVVPHGVDPSLYRPLAPLQREALRRKLGWDPYFVFLSVGSMAGAKGVALMLRALAGLAERYPHLRLVLKGNDAMYDSRQCVRQMAGTLTEREKNLVLERIIYLGDSLSFADMARLYQAADAYLSPYLAEGFNLPALEAAACGLPVVCTRGGATDDFAHPRYFLGIESRLQEKRISKAQTHLFLVPDPGHLALCMARVVESDALRRESRRHLPAWVHARFSWSVVAQRLFDLLFPS